MRGTPGFFDVEQRLNRLSDLGDQLVAFAVRWKGRSDQAAVGEVLTPALREAGYTTMGGQIVDGSRRRAETAQHRGREKGDQEGRGMGGQARQAQAQGSRRARSNLALPSRERTDDASVDQRSQCSATRTTSRSTAPSVSSPVGMPTDAGAYEGARLRERGCSTRLTQPVPSGRTAPTARRRTRNSLAGTASLAAFTARNPRARPMLEMTRRANALNSRVRSHVE